ncbi:hypothetical protein HLRTI_000443 [Halorhabdus tiamatea SARL4B]|uniref:Uncharacterized protein n=1 Tax=Halorhabdus tiamatea SARL4B TaxID=1033806 RepID=F7PLK9_9EURY|nr:hypothetical protein [Halorhabdus tiamatea]ERJ07401.1 hypothetical protein HLRTI_000443 [Halorhabdus tiamatea SARL4B]
MISQNTSRTVAERNDLVPETVGDFERARRFEGGGTSRVATWVYGPDHGGDFPAGWALILSYRRNQVWLSANLLKASQEEYISLRTIADEKDVGEDPFGEIVEIAKVILKNVSEEGDPDLLETIGVEDIEIPEVNHE